MSDPTPPTQDPAAPAAAPGVAPAAPPQAYGQPTGYAPAGYAPGGYPPARPTNVLAIISLVASLVGIFVAILGPAAGVIMGHIALAQIKRTGEGGRPLALAGVIIGYVLIGVQVIGTIGYVIFLVTTLSTYSNGGNLVF